MPRTRFIQIVVLVLFVTLSSNAVARDFRVMSWNVGDMDIFDGAGTERVATQIEIEKSIAGIIHRLNPDILLLVEAPSFTELQGFVERNDLDYQVAHLRQQVSRRDFADGMALLFRLPLQDISLVTPAIPGTNRTPEDYYKDWSYRGLLVAEFQPFTVVGVHLKSPWDGKRRSYAIRDAQARALLNYLESFHSPVIVMGDFNDDSGLGTKELEFGLPDTISLLESVLIRAPGEGVTQKSGYGIDYIFVRGATVGPRHIENSSWDLSDHRPVWADVTIPIR